MEMYIPTVHTVFVSVETCVQTTAHAQLIWATEKKGPQDARDEVECGKWNIPKPSSTQNSVLCSSTGADEKYKGCSHWYGLNNWMLPNLCAVGESSYLTAIHHLIQLSHIDGNLQLSLKMNGMATVNSCQCEHSSMFMFIISYIS